MADTAPDATRAQCIAGLRKIADALEGDPLLPLPWDGTGSPLSVFTDTREECAAWARLLDGVKNKHVEPSGNYGFRLSGAVDGVAVRVFAPREEVCRRVVVGTREVRTEVPDPDALAAVPTVTVTTTVEDVEWQCSPLLAEAGVAP